MHGPLVPPRGALEPLSGRALGPAPGPWFSHRLFARSLPFAHRLPLGSRGMARRRVAGVLVPAARAHPPTGGLLLRGGWDPSGGRGSWRREGGPAQSQAQSGCTDESLHCASFDGWTSGRSTRSRMRAREACGATLENLVGPGPRAGTATLPAMSAVSTCSFSYARGATLEPLTHPPSLPRTITFPASSTWSETPPGSRSFSSGHGSWPSSSSCSTTRPSPTRPSSGCCNRARRHVAGHGASVLLQAVQS
jgi:hypothetical protein